MSAQHKLQENLRHAIMTADSRYVEADLVPGRAPMAQIHANHFRISLGEALAASFPVTRRIIGDECFAALARHYILDKPPESPCLFEYGETFADYIQHFPACRDLPYLPDMARFEWALIEAAHAEDAVVLVLEGLANISPERVARLRFIPHPAARLVSSDYPLQEVWHVSQPDAESSATVDLDGGGVDILVTRPALDVEWRVVSTDAAAMFRKLHAGGKLQDAVTAGTASGEFDAAAALLDLVNAGAFHGLTPDYSGLPRSETWRIDVDFSS
jgi:hypothetical protein